MENLGDEAFGETIGGLGANREQEEELDNETLLAPQPMEEDEVQIAPHVFSSIPNTIMNEVVNGTIEPIAVVDGRSVLKNFPYDFEPRRVMFWEFKFLKQNLKGLLGFMNAYRKRNPRAREYLRLRMFFVF